MAKSGTPVAKDIGNTRPDTGNPAEEKSIPSSAPGATTTRITGATNQSKAVKIMNEKANRKSKPAGSSFCLRRLGSRHPSQVVHPACDPSWSRLFLLWHGKGDIRRDTVANDWPPCQQSEA